MSLLGELKRRNVFRVAMLYVVAAWLVIEVAETVLPIFEVPDGVLRGLVVLLVIGIVPALGFAWIYELTPEGLKRDSGVTENTEFSATTGHRLNWATLVVAVLAISFLAYDRLVPRDTASETVAGQPPASAAAPATADPQLPAQERTTAAANERPAVAVLPFANLSTDPEQEFFADGITEDILTRLAGVSGLRVISRTSVMRYKNTELSLPEIAAELGVSHVLEGSVRRAGDRVRITGQLIRAADDAHLWADSFDRELADIFSVQTEIAQRIAQQLELQLTDRDRQLLTQQGTGNPEAYEHVLRARAIGRKSFSTPDEITALIDEAEHHLRAAVELDPDYAEAWALLAQSYLQRSSRRIAEPDAVANWEQSVQAARRAIRLAPDRAAGYLALGQAFRQRGQIDSALEQFRLAGDLEPDSADVLLAQGTVMASRGELLAGLDMLERAAGLAPGEPIVWDNLADLYTEFGDYEAARRALRRAWEELTPHEARLNCLLMTVAVAEGDYARGETHVERFLELEGGYSPIASNCAVGFYITNRDFAAAGRLIEAQQPFFLTVSPLNAAIVMSLSGQPAEPYLASAEKNLERAVPRSSEGVRLFTRARIAMLRGQNDAALDLLERAIEAGYWPEAGALAHAPEWDAVREDGRFRAVAEQLDAARARMRAEYAARTAALR